MWFYIVVKYILCALRIVAAFLSYLLFNESENTFFKAAYRLWLWLLSYVSRYASAGNRNLIFLFLPTQSFDIYLPFGLVPHIQSMSFEVLASSTFSHTAVGPTISSFYDSSDSVNMTLKVPFRTVHELTGRSKASFSPPSRSIKSLKCLQLRKSEVYNLLRSCECLMLGDKEKERSSFPFKSSLSAFDGSKVFSLICCQYLFNIMLKLDTCVIKGKWTK